MFCLKLGVYMKKNSFLVALVVILTILFVPLYSGSGSQNKYVFENFDFMKVGYFPGGWVPQRHIGYNIVKVVKEGSNKFLRISSKNDSCYIGKQIYYDKASNLYDQEADDREEGFDLAKYPILTWRWRVHKLPKNGSERDSNTNDSGAAVAVGFKKGLIRYSLKYVWSNSVPEGTVIPSPGFMGSHTRIFVLKSGKKKMGRWYTEKRNIYEDYKRAFGEYPDRFSKGIAFLTDSNDTETAAVADYDDIILMGKK